MHCEVVSLPVMYQFFVCFSNVFQWKRSQQLVVLFSCKSRGGLCSSKFFSSVCHIFDDQACSSLLPPLPSVSAVGLFFPLQTPWADSRCYLSPVLLCTLPGLLLFLLRLSGWSCMLCGQLRGPPLGVGGRLASSCYSHGAAAENAPECISSSTLAFTFLSLCTHIHFIHSSHASASSLFSCWGSSGHRYQSSCMDCLKKKNTLAAFFCADTVSLWFLCLDWLSGSDPLIVDLLYLLSNIYRPGSQFDDKWGLWHFVGQ